MRAVACITVNAKAQLLKEGAPLGPSIGGPRAVFCCLLLYADFICVWVFLVFIHGGFIHLYST